MSRVVLGWGFVVAAAAGLALGGCTGGMNDADAMDVTGFDEIDAGPVSFATVYAQVIVAPAPEGDGPTCGAACHVLGGAMGASAGLNLSTEQAAYDGLLGTDDAGAVAATRGFCMPADVTMRVERGDPERSMLYRRIIGTSCAEQMPQRRTPLTAAQIDLVRRWIERGGLR